MEKYTCPECGNPTNISDTVCSECGCKLPERKPTDMTRQAYLQRRISEIGSIEAWEKENKSEAQTNLTLTIISAIFGICALILGITFIVYLIVNGIKTSNQAEMFAKFQYETIRFTLSTAVLLVVGDIFSQIRDGYELQKCTAWLSRNNIDGTKCLTLVDFSGQKKRKSDNLAHNLDVAYYGANRALLKKRIIGLVVEEIFRCITIILLGIVIAPTVNQLLIARGKAPFWNPYIAYGFSAATAVGIGIMTLIDFIVKRKFSSPAEEWFLSVKNGQK